MPKYQLGFVKNYMIFSKARILNFIDLKKGTILLAGNVFRFLAKTFQILHDFDLIYSVEKKQFNIS